MFLVTDHDQWFSIPGTMHNAGFIKQQLLAMGGCALRAEQC